MTHTSEAAIPAIGDPSEACTTTFKREFKRNTWVPSSLGQRRALAMAAGPSVGVATDPDCGTKYDRETSGTPAWAAGTRRDRNTMEMNLPVGEFTCGSPYDAFWSCAPRTRG